VHWDGIEYWDHERQRGVIYAFRGTVKEENLHSFPLKGLQPSVHYRLRFHDHSAPDRSVTGRELTERGLKVDLNLPNSSELIFIEGEAH
jgi:hypothetical protein